MTRTSYTIDGTVTGKLWWPIGQDAGKPVAASFTRSNEQYATRDEAATLRDMLESVMAREDGDFSSAGRMTADSLLIVTRESQDGRRIHRHAYPLTAFASIRDYVTDELYSSDFDGSNED